MCQQPHSGWELLFWVIIFRRYGSNNTIHVNAKYVTMNNVWILLIRMSPGSGVPGGSLLGFLISAGCLGLVQRWVVLAQNAFPREGNGRGRECGREGDLYTTGPGVVLYNYTFVRARVRVNFENGVMSLNRFGFQNGRPSPTGLAENHLHEIPSL